MSLTNEMPPTEKPTMNEAIADLTGLEYDDLVRLCKGNDPTTYGREHPVEFTYALVCVMRLRTTPGLTLLQLKQEVRVGQLDTYFSPEPDAEQDETAEASVTGND